MDAGTPSGSGPSDAGLPGGVGPSSQAEQNEEPATVQTMRASSVPQAAVQRHVWPVFARPTIQRVSIPQAPVPVQRDFKKQTYKLSSTKIAVVKGDAKKKMAEIDESPADYSAAILKKAGLKPEDWFKSFTTTTFLGRSIGEPIHTDLAAHLKDVEKKFTDKYGGDDKSPAKAGDALGLSHESIAGGREAPTSAVFSMHLFGLAVDLNYTANPFISASANPVFNRAGLLVDGTAAAWKPNMSYDDLSALDKKLETYFSYLDKPDDLKARLDASTAAPWKGMAPEKAKKQIQADLDLVARKWERSDPSKKATIKAGGFMDLKKELVEGIGLNWGASYGDMMHFDMRNKGNGAKIEAAIGQYKAEKEKESKEQYQKEHGKEAMAEEGGSDTAVALNEEGNEAEDAAPGETGAGSAAGEPQPVQAMRAPSGLSLAGHRGGPVLARPPVQRVSVSRARSSVQRDTPDAGSSVAAPPPAKQTIATIEQFIKFVETVEGTYPTADPKEVASEIRQIWFSDPNWEVLLGSQGISSTDASGKKTYTDIETEAPIATAYDMKDLDPRGTEKKIRTPLGEVAISHVIAGIDAALSGAPSSYPQNFLKDRGHDSDDTRLKYDTLKAADAGDPRDFTTWSGDLGQAYAEYLVERWVKASTGASLASFVSDKASDDQLLGDIHGYIAKQVATEVPPSKGAAAKVGKVSDILRSLYMAGKKDAGADQSYMHYFEQAAGKKAADLRPFILERTLAFARPWYANKAFAASGSSDVGRWWSSKGFKAKTILENHMKDFDKWHAENESKATAPNKIGEYIDKFLKMLGQKMP